MKPVSLAPASVERLEVFANPCDVHRDLHMYMEYMAGREVKRMHRSNELPKADARRLAKLLSDPDALDMVNQEGGSSWLDFIDQLALLLGLVQYKVEGVYVGYSSTEPSYPDNYVIVHNRKYAEFLELPPGEQEKRILKTLIEHKPKYGGNEFYTTGFLGRLDPFNSWGAATGVMPTLDFASARRFLLDFLKGCSSGVWHSTASLVEYLKRNHPHFLIPKVLEPDRWGKIPARYGNFYETQKRYRVNEAPISDDALDGFERVEGRYIERFLEGIPLIMRYVEVAYDLQPYRGLYPERNRLQAFRLTSRLQNALDEEFNPPRITVQPNFEVIVESEVYPARLLSQLRLLTEPVSDNPGGINASVTILALKKERVAAALVQNPELDILGLLRGMAGRDLPQNVAVELEEWSGHADLFTLYTGFGLLESGEALSQAGPYVVERISPQSSLVRSPAKLLHKLEAAELAPVWVEHSSETLAAVPQGVNSAFAKRQLEVQDQAQEPRPVTLLSTTIIKLRFPEEEIFQDFRHALLETRCPVEANDAERTITYALGYQPCVDQAIKAVEKAYRVRIVEG